MKRKTKTRLLCAAVSACVCAAVWGAAALPPVQADALPVGKAAAPAAKASPEKEAYESRFRTSALPDFSEIAKIVQEKGGTCAAQNADGTPVSENDPLFIAQNTAGSRKITADVTDVHLSDRLEYGLTPEDGDGFIPEALADSLWLESCTLNADGTLSSKHYAFAYVTVRIENTGSAEGSVYSGTYRLGQYNADGCLLNTSLCTADKRALVNGKAEPAADTEADVKSGKVTAAPGQTRDLVLTYLVSDTFSEPILDPAAEESTDIADYATFVQTYSTGIYTETDCRYSLDIYGSCGPVRRFDISGIVRDYFAENK